MSFHIYLQLFSCIVFGWIKYILGDTTRNRFYKKNDNYLTQQRGAQNLFSHFPLVAKIHFNPFDAVVLATLHSIIL